MGKYNPFNKKQEIMRDRNKGDNRVIYPSRFYRDDMTINGIPAEKENRDNISSRKTSHMQEQLEIARQIERGEREPLKKVLYKF